VKKYNVIYTDPPWDYDSKRIGRKNGSAAYLKYNTLTLDDLKEMPVGNITDTDALCFMWATVPLLPEAMALMAAWGFRYKTMITWEKTGGLGMGHWMRIQTEHLLVGVKGDAKPFRHQEKNIYKHPVCEHSAKPHFFRELVMKLAEKSLADCTRLEMFARSREGFFSDYEYEGWDVFGNQVNNSIELPMAQPIAAAV
jgi:N6-adenosine-specific RNA methylase IME4